MAVLSNQVVVISNQVLQVMVIVTDDFDTLTLLPPPERCVSHRTPSNGEGGGRSGGLKGHGDRTGGLQSGARSGTKAEWGARRPWWVRGLRRPWRCRALGGHGGSGNSGRMAVQSAWAAMADPRIRGAMADQEILWLGPWPGHTGHGYMAPQKKILGEVPSGSSSGGTGSGGTLEAWTLGGALEARTLGGALGGGNASIAL